MAATGVERPVMIGYSRGSPYAFGAALHSPAGVRGLVINDYQARQVGLGPEMVERLLEMKTRGRTTAERMPEHAVRQVVLESQEIPLWDRIPELDAPVLVLRGGKSMVVDEEAQEKYLAASPRVRIETLPDRGHGLWSSSDRSPYLALAAPLPRRGRRQRHVADHTRHARAVAYGHGLCAGTGRVSPSALGTVSHRLVGEGRARTSSPSFSFWSRGQSPPRL